MLKRLTAVPDMIQKVQVLRLHWLIPDWLADAFWVRSEGQAELGEWLTHGLLFITRSCTSWTGKVASFILIKG